LKKYTQFNSNREEPSFLQRNVILRIHFQPPISFFIIELFVSA